MISNMIVEQASNKDDSPLCLVVIRQHLGPKMVLLYFVYMVFSLWNDEYL